MVFHLTKRQCTPRGTSATKAKSGDARPITRGRGRSCHSSRPGYSALCFVKSKHAVQAVGQQRHVVLDPTAVAAVFVVILAAADVVSEAADVEYDNHGGKAGTQNHI